MFIPTKWKAPRVVYALFASELPLIVAILALTGIASPNLYRDKLWQEGGDLGFNSKPFTVVLAHANYQPVKTPLVWSYLATQYNLVISVLSMFLLLTKVTTFVMNIFFPIVSFFLHACLAAVWAVSIYIQLSSDTIDPEHRNPGPPWYITKSCNVARGPKIQGYCKQAKSVFAVSVLMLALFLVHIGFAIWSFFPNAEQKENHRLKVEEKEREKASPASDISNEQQWQQQWELQQMPRTPGTIGGMKSPMTPRTRAFHDLDGGNSDLPFRRNF